MCVNTCMNKKVLNFIYKLFSQMYWGEDAREKKKWINEKKIKGFKMKNIRENNT